MASCYHTQTRNKSPLVYSLLSTPTHKKRERKRNCWQWWSGWQAWQAFHHKPCIVRMRRGESPIECNPTDIKWRQICSAKRLYKFKYIYRHKTNVYFYSFCYHDNVQCVLLYCSNLSFEVPADGEMREEKRRSYTVLGGISSTSHISGCGDRPTLYSDYLLGCGCIFCA